jgi:hypothetical protein
MSSLPQATIPRMARSISACLVLLVAASVSCTTTSSTSTDGSSEPIPTPQPTYATGISTVPADVLRATLFQLNSRVCNQGGGLTKLAAAAETPLDQALRLLPDDGSLSSLSDGMPLSTHVYDMLLVGGDCRTDRKTVASVEVIVAAPKGERLVTIAEVNGSYGDVQHLDNPFGRQWD